MAREKSPAQIIFEQVVDQAVTPLLKTAGFRKRAANYHRRHGDTVQVVNLQGSQSSSASEKRFYVNVGIAFDAICQLAGAEVLERPKEYDCDARGVRDRIESLVSGCPERWEIHPGQDIGSTLQSLHACIQALLENLDRINSPASYASHPWFNHWRPSAANAQILYLIGDMDGAWREVQALSSRFAGRQNGERDRPEWWIDDLKLSELKSRAVR